MREGRIDLNEEGYQAFGTTQSSAKPTTKRGMGASGRPEAWTHEGELIPSSWTVGRTTRSQTVCSLFSPSYILYDHRLDQISWIHARSQNCRPTGHFFVCKMSIKDQAGALPK